MKPYAFLASENHYLKTLGLFLLSIALTLGIFSLANAQSSVNACSLNQLAIKGTDPVAYFVEGKPVKGTKRYQVQWGGAVWHFSSQANKEAFEANPEAFAPQYGGFCAWAVSQGYTADIDPNAWDIVDGKLYLNYSKSVQKTWSKDRTNRIVQTDQNWPRLAAK